MSRNELMGNFAREPGGTPTSVPTDRSNGVSARRELREAQHLISRAPRHPYTGTDSALPGGRPSDVHAAQSELRKLEDCIANAWAEYEAKHVAAVTDAAMRALGGADVNNAGNAVTQNSVLSPTSSAVSPRAGTHNWTREAAAKPRYAPHNTPDAKLGPSPEVTLQRFEQWLAPLKHGGSAGAV